MSETNETGGGAVPSPVLPGQREAREAGTRGTRFRDQIKVGKGIISAFLGGESEKRPTEGQNIQYPIFYFVRFRSREDFRAHRAKALLVVLIWKKNKNKNTPQV